MKKNRSNENFQTLSMFAETLNHKSSKTLHLFKYISSFLVCILSNYTYSSGLRKKKFTKLGIVIGLVFGYGLNNVSDFIEKILIKNL